MLVRISGWILIFIHFLITETRREIVIAAQTIFCAVTIEEIRPYHIATGVLIAVSTASFHSNTDFIRLILLHVTILAAVILEYQSKFQLKYVAWISVVWIMRWLNCNSFYNSPIRSILKCILYIIISNLRQKYLDANYYKCIWIMLVHETCFIFAPIQLMHEIYRKTKKEESFIV